MSKEYNVGDLMENGKYKAGLAIVSEKKGVRVVHFKGYGGSSTGWSWKDARKLRDGLTKALRGNR